jgi:hypothetical protein
MAMEVSASLPRAQAARLIPPTTPGSRGGL